MLNSTTAQPTAYQEFSHMTSEIFVSIIKILVNHFYEQKFFWEDGLKVLFLEKLLILTSTLKNIYKFEN